jgi:hypothetical protein
MLIALCGYKGSGKDTCADYLVEKYGFKKMAFADHLKTILKTMFMFTDEQLYGTIEQKETPDPNWYGCTPRLAMQFVGTELIRNQLDTIMPGLGSNYFVKYLEMQIMAMRKENPSTNIVISDMRCDNEYDMVNKLGGFTFRVDRDTIEKVDLHMTETAFLKFDVDFIIKNDSDIESLREKINIATEALLVSPEIEKIIGKPGKIVKNIII